MLIEIADNVYINHVENMHVEGKKGGVIFAFPIKVVCIYGTYQS